MREIKFRAWSVDCDDFGRMINLFDLFRDSKLYAKMKLHELAYASTDESIIGKGIIIPMQYIGRLDKNGKEIYEGDIMKCDLKLYLKGSDEKIEIKHAVIYSDCSYKIQGYVEGKKVVSSWQNFNKWEVIGNIYENKELLE